MWFWDAVASDGPYANNFHLAVDRQPHQHLIAQFLQAGCSSWHPVNSVKALNCYNWFKCGVQINTHLAKCVIYLLLSAAGADMSCSSCSNSAVVSVATDKLT